jgi:hypothetical protein
MPETVVHFQIRLHPSVYEKLASRAKEGKESLNALVVRTLEAAVDGRGARSDGTSSAVAKAPKA